MKGDLQDWMSCAAPLPNKQSKEFQVASTWGQEKFKRDMEFIEGAGGMA